MLELIFGLEFIFVDLISAVSDDEDGDGGGGGGDFDLVDDDVARKSKWSCLEMLLPLFDLPPPFVDVVLFLFKTDFNVLWFRCCQ